MYKNQEPRLLDIGHFRLGLRLGVDVVFQCAYTMRYGVPCKMSNVHYPIISVFDVRLSCAQKEQQA